MSKKKERNKKQLKKLRRIHIVPHILLMLFLAIFVAFTIIAFQVGYAMYLVDGKTQLLDERLNTVIENVSIKESNGQTQVKYMGSTNIPEVYAIDIVDAQGNSVYSSGENTFAAEVIADNGYAQLSIAEAKEIYVTESDIEATGLEIVGEEFSFDKFIAESIRSGFKDLDIVTDDIDSEFCRVKCWIGREIIGTEYSVYLKSYFNILNKERWYMTMMLVLSLIMSGIPFILYIVVFITSIKNQARGARIIQYDSVTGGKNWMYFQEKADKILHRNRRKQIPYYMVNLRMDKYQNFCMCYGNRDGEIVLEHINDILTKFMNRKEVFARYAEADFGLLIKGEDQKYVIDRLMHLKESLADCAGGRSIDFSCGVYEINDYESFKFMDSIPDELFSNASVARKTITGDSKNRIAWFNEELKSDQLWETYVTEHMDKALENGEFRVYIQPKFNASTRTLGGAEALIRWISPTEGLVSPGKFIPIFEKNGFITKIDDFMLSSVAALQAEWIKQGKKVVPISVNVSRAHFTQADLAEHICRIVDSTGAPKDCIELELTESAFFNDKDVLINTVAKLRNYGFKVSMDDFGADYSSLNSLKDMQLDVIKLDAGFFRGKAETEERGSVIVEEVIRLAKHLDMKIVAEGIEHAEQVEFLADKGCDLIQGFYFAKPMTVEDYENVQNAAQDDR